ncbi:Protein FLN-2 b, partial [Aphelenchoides avenae]
DSFHIANLETDLCDGLFLIRLVEKLQQRICAGKVYSENPTELQKLMNVQMVLDALREDGVKLVNIGSHDIVGGNLKLIFGLIWCLIQRYQIGRHSKVPPKKLILAWLQAVVPELKLVNFRTNWNDGIALSALLEYCQPGLFPTWRSLDPSERWRNCNEALSLAQSELGIPDIISADHLSSQDLDEQSCLTYLSYFVKKNAPGYKATLRDVQAVLRDIRVPDFEAAWSDGYLLCRMVEAAGGHVVGLSHMNFDDPQRYVWNVRTALESCMELGVRAMVSPEDIAHPESEDHLGVMALCAALANAASQNEPAPDYNSEGSSGLVTECFQNQTLNLDLSFADGSVNAEELDVVIVSADGRILEHKGLELTKTTTDGGAVLSFVPHGLGLHRIHILCDKSELPTSPITVNVVPWSGEKATAATHERCASSETPSTSTMTDFYERSHIGHVSFSGLNEPCSIGSVVEVVINAQGGRSTADDVVVVAISPSGNRIRCEVVHRAGSFTATFTPDEVGQWQIGILYNGEHIRGSPFDCHVYDTSEVSVYGLDVGLVGQELKFTVDASKAGRGHVKVTIMRHGRHIPCEILEDGSGRYRVRFTPDGPGQYKIHIAFNNNEIKGSPFILDIADANSVSVQGDNLRMAAVDRLATFFVHAVGADTKDLTVIIT